MRFKKQTAFILFCVAIIFSDWIYLCYFRTEPPSQFENYYDQKIQFQGTVIHDPTLKGYNEIVIVQPEGFDQEIQLNAFHRNEFRYGDRVWVKGKLRRPKNQNGYDEQHRFQMENIYAKISFPEVYILGNSPPNIFLNQLITLKHKLYRRIAQLYSKEKSALLIAFLLGDKAYLSAEQAQAFNSIGTAHMIAVSGYKLTLLLISIEFLLPYLGRRKLNYLSGAIILVYLSFADFAPAVMRSAIMSTIFIYTKASGRRYKILPVLAAAAVILIINNPLILKYDLGFILSFAGITGIVLWNPYVHKLFNWLPKTANLREIATSTTSAQLATLPIMIYYFHQLPFIAPLINLMIVPLLSPIIILGYLSLIPLANLVLTPLATLVVNYIWLTVSAAVKIPKAFIPASLTPTQFLLIYTFEIALYSVIRYRSNIKKKHE